MAGISGRVLAMGWIMHCVGRRCQWKLSGEPAGKTGAPDFRQSHFLIAWSEGFSPSFDDGMARSSPERAEALTPARIALKRLGWACHAKRISSFLLVMNRFRLFAAVFLCVGIHPLSFGAEARPNVIFILTDDQGWGDAGFAGHPYVKTPNLDRLASEGTWFRQFYVAATVC